MGTSKKLTGQRSSDPMCYVVAIRVSHSAPLENDKVKTIRVTCGLGSEKPLANFDLDTQSWRMFGDISLWGDSPSLVNLPPSGMTRSGVLFPRQAWVPITDATASSSWPTPRASAAMNEDISTIQKRLANGKKWGAKLEQSVALWPTPTAHPDNTKTTGKFKNAALGDAVRMWGTPRAAMGETRNHTVYERSLDKPQNLENQVATSNPSAIGGKLNPMWVEWLMGFPLGWTDLEDSATP